MLNKTQGHYSQAEPLHQRALAISEQVLGPDHPSVATNLTNLAELYRSQGLYIQAERIYQRAKAINEKVLGPDHPVTALSLNNLAVLYVSQGLYSQADPLFQRALAINEKALGMYHPSTATILNNLAELYSSQGLYSQAEPLFQRALAIKEQALRAVHPDAALILNNLAILYLNQALYSQAEPLFQRALAINEEALGPDHPSIALSLNNLAGLYKSRGLYKQAEPLFQRALTICESVLGFDHPSTAASLTGLAGLYRKQGCFSQAESLIQRALAITEQALGEDHPYTFFNLNNLALLYTEWQKYSIAIPCFAASTRSQLSWLHREAPLMASANRRQLLDLRQELERLPLELIANDPKFSQLFLFARLNRHGLLQQIEQRQAQVASLPGLHRPLVERLQAVVSVLASSQLDPDRRSALAEERDQLEAQLYRLLPDLQIKTVEVSDVAAALPPDAALIEFQRYVPRTDVGSEAGSSPRYMAFILSPGGRIEAIDLGPAAPLEAAIVEATADTVDCFADAALAWRALSEQLLPPLLPHLEGCRCWYVSLDGELHRVPFHALPLPHQPDQLLVETVNIRLVTSGRDLLDHHRTPESISSEGPGLVVADPSFDQSSGSSSQEPPDIASHQWRSRDMGALTVWKPLPGTAKEGKQLAELLGASLLTGTAATTLAVQQTQRPRVLHIATHGFFLADQSEMQTEQPWLPAEGNDLLARFRGEDPMLRSGLVFAGANHPVSDPQDDDGYLTAQEAVHLDLQGTELVTLSACDAGRGDIHAGEGVYGLQRALIVAGARSMLLSLWQVPDEATCEFMVRFYTLLKQGAGRYEALVAVQREFRHHDNFVWRHPYFWGAWQLIGDWRPIEDL
nr:tetratricopeptide repeat protein [Synechococcus sp. EJ6-Ellesmere]